MAQVSKCAGLGARLGLVASTAELTASLSPSDYLYGAPTEAQRQHFLRQATSPSGTPNQQAAVAPSMADAYGTRAALQGGLGSWAPRCAVLAASLPSDRASAARIHKLVGRGHWHAQRRCIAPRTCNKVRNPSLLFRFAPFCCSLGRPPGVGWWHPVDAPARGAQPHPGS